MSVKQKHPYPCPLCGEPMTVVKGDWTGVYLVCNGPCDPLCHENVTGHGKDEASAYATACEHYRKPND